MCNAGLHAGPVGGGRGHYYSNRGEVLVWRRCPRDFAFYVMDDDVSAGVMQAGSEAGTSGLHCRIKPVDLLCGVHYYHFHFNEP